MLTLLAAALLLGQNNISQFIEAGSTPSVTFTVCQSGVTYNRNTCDILTNGSDDDIEINAMLDAVASLKGEVALLHGTYTLDEPLQFSSNTTLTLKAGALVIPEASYTPTVVPSLGGHSLYTLVLPKTYATTRTNKFVLQGEGRISAEGVTGLVDTVSWAAVMPLNAEQVTIKGVEIDNILYTVTQDGGSTGNERYMSVALFDCNDCLVDSVHAHHTGDDTIRISRSSDRSTVRDSLVHDAKFGHNIELANTTRYGTIASDPDSNDNKITGNTAYNAPFTDWATSSITVHTGNNTQISNNTIYHAGAGVLLIGDQALSTVVTGNNIRDVVDACIVLKGNTGNNDVEGVTITGNTCVMSSSTVNGVQLDTVAFDIRDVTITGNRIIGTDGSSQNGVYLHGSSGEVITNVTITGNTIRNLGNPAVWIQSAGGTIENVSVIGNTVKESDYLILVDGSSGTVRGLTMNDNTHLSATSGDRGIRINTASSVRAANNIISTPDLEVSETGTNSDVLFLNNITMGAGTDYTLTNATTRVQTPTVWLQGVAPTLSNCGTTPSVTGTDRAGKITVGTGVVTACTLTFAAAYPSAPNCIINNETQILVTQAVSTTTTLTLNAAVSIDADVISYACSP